MWMGGHPKIADQRLYCTVISHLLNIELLGKGYLTNFVFCVVGAVTVLWIWKKLFY